MTGEATSAKVRPPELAQLNIFAASDMRQPVGIFHDYARSNNNNNIIMAFSTKLSNMFSHRPPNAPYIIIPEHSLVTECSPAVYSPNNILMYEPDPLDRTKALMSPGASECLSSLSPCASECLASPTSTTSWKRDGWDQPATLEEESFDLTAYDSSPIWGQTDGPPIQEYLTGILGSDSTINDLRNELSALASPKAEFSIKNEETDADDSGVNLIVSDGHSGMKDESGDGPTLAQLNDGESVLDIMSTPARQVSQSWGSSPSVSLQLADSHTTSTSWSAGYMNNLPVTSLAVTLNVNPTVPMTSPRSSTTITSQSLSSPTSNPVQLNNHGRLASLLSANNPTFDKTRIQDNGFNAKQELLTQTVPPAIPATGDFRAGLQDLLCCSPQMVGSTATTLTSQSAAVPNQPKKKPQTGKHKRSQSPNQDSNSSSSSMERKWEEIRDYVDSNRLTTDTNRMENPKRGDAVQVPQSAAEDGGPLLKKIKMEPEDAPEEVGYGNHGDMMEEEVVKEEVESDYDHMDNSDDDDDFSDVDSDCSYSSFISDLRRTSKKDKRHFWQYNTQSKGPKGKRLCKSMQERDPHCLADFEDPVFQPDCVDARYKHNGKARKGDGNDITPTPWRLFQLGNELLKLSKKINSIGSSVPMKTKDGVKSKSRREKNKFASRACRLKKKAQHEANKLKLFGLEEEHRQLMEVLRTIKTEVYRRVINDEIADGESFVKLYDHTIRENLTAMIAGNTTEYVTTVLGKVADGDRTGGVSRDRL